METNQDKQVQEAKEQQIKFYEEMLPLKRLQAEYQGLCRDLVKAMFEEKMYLQQLANFEKPQKGIPHTITQEDLDNNPDLIKEGLKVGDDVLIPETEEDPDEAKFQAFGSVKG